MVKAARSDIAEHSLIPIWQVIAVTYLSSTFVPPARFEKGPELSRRQLVPLLGLACLPLAPEPSDAEAIWRSMPVGAVTEPYPGRFVAYLQLGRIHSD